MSEDRPDTIRLGMAERMEPMHLSLPGVFSDRLLVQASSGGGKSWTLRRILEQSFGQAAPIIVDPDGEYVNLAERFGYPVVRLARVPIENAHDIAKRAREHQTPMLLDASEMKPETRMARLVPFFEGLLDVDLETAKPMLAVIDEVHLIAPQASASAADRETRRNAVSALTELVARGRKRGIGIIAATQRLSKLAGHVAAEFGNVLIGKQTLDRDIKRAADLLSWSHDRTATLREFQPGDFMAVGSALSPYPTYVRVGPVETRHVSATPDLEAPELRAPEEHARLLNLEEDLAQSDIEETGGAPASKTQGGGTLPVFLARESAPLATRVTNVLASITPNAAEIPNLADHLNVETDRLEDAISLLDTFGLIEVRRNAKIAKVRLSAAMRRHVTAEPEAVGLAYSTTEREQLAQKADTRT